MPRPADYRTHFPRVSLELAAWLVERDVWLLGVQSPSVASLRPEDVQELIDVHQTLLNAEMVIVEGLANLHLIDREEVQFVALPLKLDGIDGSPTRPIAIIIDVEGRTAMRPATHTGVTMQTYHIAILPGDGIGKEIMPQAVNVLKAAAEVSSAFELQTESFPWGAEHFLATGEFMPANGLDILKGFDALLFVACGHPDVTDFRSSWEFVFVIRKGFKQYVNTRPVKSYAGVPTLLTAPDDIRLRDRARKTAKASMPGRAAWCIPALTTPSPSRPASSRAKAWSASPVMRSNWPGHGANTSPTSPSPTPFCIAWCSGMTSLTR